MVLKTRISKDYFLEEYFNKKRTVKSIALENGVSRTKVRNDMLRLGLKLRTCSEAKRGALNHNFGKPRSEKARKAISEAHKKRGTVPPRKFGSDHHFWRGGPVKYTCEFCGKIFEDHRRARTYCSKQCHYDAMRAGKSGNWRGGPIEHTCEICGEKFLTNPGRVDARFCSFECYYKIPPEQTANWQDGASFLPYCSKFTQEKREKIRNKYNRVCVVSGISALQNGSRLCVDHLDENKMQGCNGIKWRLAPLSRKAHSKMQKEQNHLLLELLLCRNKRAEMNYEF